jgi:hypothetical protein
MTTKIQGGHSYLSRCSTHRVWWRTPKISKLIPLWTNLTTWSSVKPGWMMPHLWMYASRKHTALEWRRNQPSTSSSLSKHPIGGATIYRNLYSFTDCQRIVTTGVSRKFKSRRTISWDICLADVTINGVSKFVLGAVYIHPNASSSAIECCIYRSLPEYSKSIKKIIPSIEPDLHKPMIITGDFNVDVSRHRSLQDFPTYTIHCRDVFT